MMTRHYRSLVTFAAALACCLTAGRLAGRRVGEQAAARESGASLTIPTSSITPDHSQGAALSRGTVPQKSNAELTAFLNGLKDRLFQASGGTGASSAGFSNRQIAEELDKLTAAEVSACLDLLSDWPFGMARKSLALALLGRWSREDPASAARYAAEHRDDAGPFASIWMGSTFPQWASKNPREAAAALSAALKDEDDEIFRGSIGNAVFMVAEKLAQADPQAAFRHVADLPEWARDPARSAVANQVHGGGRQAFLDAIRTMPSGAERTTWQNAAALALAPVDAPAAGAWIDSLDLDDAARSAANRAVFGQWKTHDPAAAAAWAVGRLPEDQRASILTETVESWAAREPNECGRWLGSLDPSLQADPALAAFAKTIAGKDPTSARAWAERIGDAQLRDATMAELEAVR